MAATGFAVAAVVSGCSGADEDRTAALERSVRLLESRASSIEGRLGRIEERNGGANVRDSTLERRLDSLESRWQTSAVFSAYTRDENRSVPIDGTWLYCALTQAGEQHQNQRCHCAVSQVAPTRWEVSVGLAPNQGGCFCAAQCFGPIR
ncbi:MAG TPA: hypothetical protein VF342_01600 [Alphaproteobacteria bacterium]